LHGLRHVSSRDEDGSENHAPTFAKDGSGLVAATLMADEIWPVER
jgi:hypothetical protein